ncbi:MAG: replicative DNA helicase [Patescibacteria group bacterium]
MAARKRKSELNDSKGEFTPLEKIPPQNLEAEQSVLGSLLIDKDAIIKVADLIRPDDFYKDLHRMIYEAMLEIYEKREPIDILSLANKLEEKNQLALIGGRSYLADLANKVPTASNVSYYAGIVQRKATMRRLISVGSQIATLGFSESDEIDNILDKAEQSLFSVSQKYLSQRFVPIKNILTEAFDRIDELHKEKGKLRGIPTGFADLDNILAGLQKGDLVILAARPSVGKTTLALDMARHIATKEKIPVGIFSLEMSKEQLVDRLLCAEAGVDLWKMRTGRLSESEEDDDFPRIGHAMGVLAEAQLYIDDSALNSVMEIRTKARRLQTEQGLGLLVVDYLQLMEGRTEAESRVQQVSEITRALKGIAKELNIPVLVLSQLSRATEARTPPIPKLADLRESGSIEQDADVVLFIYREDLVKKDTDRPHIADIIISKHRNGPTGQIELYFDENKVSFKNLDKKLEEAPF